MKLVRTPLFAAPALGDDVWIKGELFQRGGSFKIRGALAKLASMTDAERAAGATTTSAGNHAIAVALACREEGVHATVFMFGNADPYKVALTQAAGATVNLESASAAEAFAAMAAHASESGATVVHPFDDPDLIRGAGSVGTEIVQDLPTVRTIVCPVGGGGLLSGIASVVPSGVRLIAVEPERAATLSAALAAGEPTPITPATAADALAPPYVGQANFAILRDRVAEVVSLSEADLVHGLRFAYTELKLASELGGAAAIGAMALGRVAPDGPTVVVASGGNIAPAKLRHVL